MIDPLDLLVFFVAWFFQAFTGFGAGIIIVGVLSLIYDPRAVVVSSAVANLIGTTFMFFILTRKVKPRLDILLLMILGSAPGILAGAKILLLLDKERLRLLIGIFILVLGLYDLMVQRGLLSRFSLRRSTVNTILAGFIGGLFAGLVGMGGPPPVVYLNQVLKSVEEFKSTLTLFFISNILVRLLSYSTQGGLEFFDVSLIYSSLLAIPVGVLLGLNLSRRFNPTRLKVFISVSVIFLGAMLVIEA